MIFNSAKKVGLALVAAGLLVSCTVAAAPNDRGGNRGGDNNERHEEADSGKKHRFDEHQRTVVQDYFVRQHREGKCPPGLAKKHNGCLPRGQAMKWQVGQVLPGATNWYELSRALEIQLGQAPTGYRYAAVDENVLLLELGTMLVVDVIQAFSQQ